MIPYLKHFFNIDKPSEENYDLLNKKSLMASDPNNTNFPLWDHQKMMLHRCLKIESDKNISKVTIQPKNEERYKEKELKIRETFVGVLNDPPGTGKTFVMLALIAKDVSSLNVVVVPPNLHYQWENAINAYFKPGTFKYLSINKYADTIQLWKSNKVFEGVQLILTTTMYIDPVASALTSLDKDYNKKTNIERIIVDEVDVSTNLFYNIPSSNRVWLLSASFDHTRHANIGPFNFNESEITKYICKCENYIIQPILDLKQPEINVIKLDDGEISLFLNVVTPSQLVLLNALNFKKIRSEYSFLISPDTVVNDSMFEYAKKMLIALDKEKQFLELMTEEMPHLDHSDKLSKLKQQISALDANINQYIEDENRVTKIDKVKEIASNIQKCPDEKWIFFSDNDVILDMMGELLKEAGILYATMDKGTTELTESSLNDYKTKPECRVLFMNSMRDGCGLNLENTTHILFLHYTNPNMVEQVIGRAQRPGRKTQLQIVCLYHKNESQ